MNLTESQLHLLVAFVTLAVIPHGTRRRSWKIRDACGVVECDTYEAYDDVEALLDAGALTMTVTTRAFRGDQYEKVRDDRAEFELTDAGVFKVLSR
jgi:hypothetical protein